MSAINNSYSNLDLSRKKNGGGGGSWSGYGSAWSVLDAYSCWYQQLKNGTKKELASRLVAWLPRVVSRLTCISDHQVAKIMLDIDLLWMVGNDVSLMSVAIPRQLSQAQRSRTQQKDSFRGHERGGVTRQDLPQPSTAIKSNTRRRFEESLDIHKARTFPSWSRCRTWHATTLQLRREARSKKRPLKLKEEKNSTLNETKRSPTHTAVSCMATSMLETACFMTQLHDSRFMFLVAVWRWSFWVQFFLKRIDKTQISNPLMENETMYTVW